MLGRVGPYSSQPFPALLVLQILQEAGDSSLHQLLKAFVSAGRVDHVAMVMGLHPQYLSSFWKTQYLLLRMDGPLPYHKRHYIAIMVSRGPWACGDTECSVCSQHCCWGGIWDPAEGPCSDLPFQKLRSLSGGGAHPGYP